MMPERTERTERKVLDIREYFRSAPGTESTMDTPDAARAEQIRVMRHEIDQLKQETSSLRKELNELRNERSSGVIIVPPTQMTDEEKSAAAAAVFGMWADREDLDNDAL